MYEQMECGEVCKRFHTDEKAGLTQQEAEKRLKADGKNRLKKVREETTIDRIQKQLNDPMIFVLFMAASVSILLREFSDTAIILFVIGLNTMIGVVQEGKAKKAMDALKKMTAPEATVKRNGTYRKIPAEELVKGDVVKVKAGDQVPADIRLFLCKGIEVNESALTGESTAVRKACEMMKLTAQDLYQDGIVEEVIPEPLGGAQRGHAALFEHLDTALRNHLRELCRMNGRQLADQRYKKYRQIGETRNA